MTGAVNCTDLELSTFLQALAAGYLPTPSQVTPQSAQSKSMPIASKSYQRGRTTVTFHGSQYFLTCASSMEDHGADWSMLCAEASPARTSASQAKEPASTASAAGCGARWPGSLAKFDRASLTWRTAQSSLGEGSGESLETWPRSGMTRAGCALALAMPLPSMTAKGSGWRPKWRTPSASVVEPKSNVVKLTGRKPTDPQVGLADQVGGPLNPEWVEWLMGWPIGWTDLKPLATGRFQEWLQQHSPSSEANATEPTPEAA